MSICFNLSLPAPQCLGDRTTSRPAFPQEDARVCWGLRHQPLPFSGSLCPCVCSHPQRNINKTTKDRTIMLFTVADNRNNKYLIPSFLKHCQNLIKIWLNELRRQWRTQDQSTLKSSISFYFVFCTPTATSRNDSSACDLGAPLDPRSSSVETAFYFP